jgi:hypothetical protein
VTKAVGKSSEYLGLKTPKAQNEQMFSGLPPKADAAEPYLPLPTRADSRLIRRSKGVPGVANLPATDLAAALSAARTVSHARRFSATKMGADICIQAESLARTYERPALRKAFAALPADTKVA